MDDGQRGDEQPHDQQRHLYSSHFSVNGDRNVIVGGNVYTSGVAHESYLALCDDAYGGSAYGDDEEFVGRVDLFEAVGKFLATQESGFFLLTGKAGLGKTAFATRLARKAAGYHLHVIEPHETPATVRKHLAARLIREWRLTSLLREGGLPLTADRESWFATVLTSAARQRDLESPCPPIVLVIDGLDEMRIRDSGETIGLPRQLPKGVFVVLTCRSGSPALDHWADVPRAEIVAESDANLLDMRTRLEQAVDRDALAGVIAKTGHDPREVVETLLRRCAGVWIYLRFVLDDLAKGRRSLDDLHDLPDNLWDYYVATILRWKDDNSRWHAVALPVLAALAASRSGMTADMLAEVIGARETSRVEAFLNGPLQAFCHADRVGGTIWYRLYHSSLRYFVAGETDATKRAHGDFSAPDASPLRWELRTAVVDAHDGVVEYFLRRWGALEDGLPRLAARPCSDPRDTYGLDHLIWHLQQATRFDDLHLLMAGRPLRSGPDRYLPDLPAVWLRAHQRAGSLDSFAEHVRWCYGHAYARIGQAGSSPRTRLCSPSGTPCCSPASAPWLLP